MGLDNILYHVRAAPPSSTRTLRFRNKFQHKSCLFATANRDESVRDWFSRHITATYPFIKSIEWHDTYVQFNSSETLEDVIDEIKNIATYVYQYTLDLNWNKHPTKGCYMTRSNIKYRNKPQLVTFNEAVQGREIVLYPGV